MLEMNPGVMAKGEKRFSPRTYQSTFTHPDTIPTAGPSDGTGTQTPTSIAQQPGELRVEPRANLSDDDDNMNIDFEGTATNSLDQSPTLISTASGKRKALDLPDDDETSAIHPSQLPTFVGSSTHSMSVMSAPSAAPSTSTSSARDSSALAKRKRTGKNAEVAASMQSSRAQSVKSAKQEAHITNVQAQQLVSSTVHLEKLISDNLQGQHLDPIADALASASTIINRNELHLSIDEQVDLTDALTRDPHAVTMFNSTADNKELHKAYVQRIIENYRRTRV